MEGKIKNRKFYCATIALILATIVTILIGYLVFVPCNNKLRKSTLEEKTFKSFKEELLAGNLTEVYYSSASPDLVVLTRSGDAFTTINPGYEDFKLELLEQDVLIKLPAELDSAENTETSRRGNVLCIVLALCSITLYTAYRAFLKEDVATAVSPQKEAQEASTKKTLADVIGLAEVKKDMRCLVDFLINKDKYESAGAKLPKGVILYGPPGTGKTLLAKAVAGEADVPFFYMSGSEFVEMYVGVGAKRVRELFSKARKHAPCIVFIDEIDAVGAKRTGQENSEDRKTLNALLTEMDGFKETENIIVIGATNRLEDLDNALTRPGRFTNKYCVPLPETKSDRRAILDFYTKNKKLDETISLDDLAKETAGYSPAQIEALVNESAIISVQRGSQFISRDDVDAATTKMILDGHVKEDQSERDEEELKVVAWHEAGHALVGKLCGDEIPKVTILSTTSGAGGFTVNSPKGKALHSVDDLKKSVAKLYGGRCAELVLFGDKSLVTTGASNDIERASKIIKATVANYGMDEEFGPLNLDVLGVPKGKLIDREVSLAKEIEAFTTELLKKNFEALRRIAESLIENTTIYEDDLDKIINETNAVA